ncbi:hypothetical protein C8J57DRAFT_214948 [Mycena rebaudengoi]|nr:hypothetical protein C8J57DRAFT_214948 [Mycena rebaudengoi]
MFAKGVGSDGLGGGVLRDYEFNDRQMAHRFCGTLFGIVRAGMGPADKFAFNVCMLRDVDLWALEVKTGAGLNTQTEYAVPAFPGLAELKQSKAEGEKVYDGSCHSGAVTFVLKSAAPLEEQRASSVVVKECNCSICLRVSLLRCVSKINGTHAPLLLDRGPSVRLHASRCTSRPLTRLYRTSTRWGKVLRDGCAVGKRFVDPPAEDLATFPPDVQAIFAEKHTVKPVHLRALTVALGRSAEEKAEWERIVGGSEEEGNEEGTPYVTVVPE